jgi:PPK2 family polyphosphate:nucleotide phosphotransferase
MNNDKCLRLMKELAETYRVNKGSKFRLKDSDPGDTNKMKSKEHGEELLRQSTEMLIDLQEKLYAQNRWALLVVLQGIDAAGKDGAIKHVMSGVNPEGCDVHAFKVPSEEELDHDYLWRTHKWIPERGKIGIFNRSYYEEVLVVRVHQGLLKRQRLPDEVVSKKIWQERYEDINAFERYLARNGIALVKLFLHLSKKEQKKRFLERLDDSRKNWKFSLADVQERDSWKEYQQAYEEMVQSTATKRAPWIVVPADTKWFARLVVAAGIIDALDELRLAFPAVDAVKKKELARAQQALSGQ